MFLPVLSAGGVVRKPTWGQIAYLSRLAAKAGMEAQMPFPPQ